jgi:hypothetical protein
MLTYSDLQAHGGVDDELDSGRKAIIQTALKSAAKHQDIKHALSVGNIPMVKLLFASTDCTGLIRDGFSISMLSDADIEILSREPAFLSRVFSAGIEGILLWDSENIRQVITALAGISFYLMVPDFPEAILLEMAQRQPHVFVKHIRSLISHIHSEQPPVSWLIEHLNDDDTILEESQFSLPVLKDVNINTVANTRSQELIPRLLSILNHILDSTSDLTESLLLNDLIRSADENGSIWEILDQIQKLEAQIGLPLGYDAAVQKVVRELDHLLKNLVLEPQSIPNDLPVSTSLSRIIEGWMKQAMFAEYRNPISFILAINQQLQSVEEDSALDLQIISKCLNQTMNFSDVLSAIHEYFQDYDILSQVILAGDVFWVKNANIVHVIAVLDDIFIHLKPAQSNETMDHLQGICSDDFFQDDISEWSAYRCFLLGYLIHFGDTRALELLSTIEINRNALLLLPFAARLEYVESEDLQDFIADIVDDFGPFIIPRSIYDAADYGFDDLFPIVTGSVLKDIPDEFTYESMPEVPAWDHLFRGIPDFDEVQAWFAGFLSMLEEMEAGKSHHWILLHLVALTKWWAGFPRKLSPEQITSYRKVLLGELQIMRNMIAGREVEYPVYWNGYEWTILREFRDIVGLSETLKQCLLMFRAIPESDCIIDAELKIRDTESPAAIIADFIQDICEQLPRGVDDPDQALADFAGTLISFLKPAKRRRSGWDDDSHKPGHDVSVTEPDPDWRYYYLRAFEDLGYWYDGQGHSYKGILEKRASLDPDERIREKAAELSEKISAARGAKSTGLKLRTRFLYAWWWIRQAHVITHDGQLDPVAANRTRQIEARSK